MIEIKAIDKSHQNDINIKNEPFSVFGKLLPSYKDGVWSYEILRFPQSEVFEMCFPDESYDYCAMAKSVFIGAYDGEHCVGLAILQPSPFNYMYLSDLKVKRDFRRMGIGKTLIEKAKAAAAKKGFGGIYTIGQDNNLSACLFYLKSGFYIGGLDTNVYKGTKQQGKSDIYFYSEC